MLARFGGLPAHSLTSGAVSTGAREEQILVLHQTVQADQAHEWRDHGVQRGTPPTSLGLGGWRDGVQEGAGWTAHAARRLPRRAAGWGGQEAAGTGWRGAPDRTGTDHPVPRAPLRRSSRRSR